MTRICIALITAIALLAAPVGAAADQTSTTTASAAAKKKKKSSVPRQCKKLKGKKRTRCIAKYKKCKKGYVKRKGKCRKLPKAPTPPNAGPKFPSTTPIDYTKIAGLSKVVFSKDDIERTVTEVPGADGINLYIEVVKPKKEGRYPVILESSGYHGTLYQRDGIRILPDPKDEDGKPLGLTGYFPPRGYAIVMMDLRGTGRSEGCLDHLGQNDLSDIKAVIEWAAQQPWSNGRVGMTGHSYVGGTTNLGGASGAKGLATIVPSASLASMYDHQFQWGVPYFAQYLGPIEAYESLALFADLPPQASPVTNVAGGPSGDNFGNDPQYTGCGMANSAGLAGSGQVTGQYEKFHFERDHREAVKKADIPIFMNHGTIDAAARIGGVQWFFERGLKPGDKLWLAQWDHGIGVGPTRRGLQWTYALHAWFDKHLMQRDVDTGAPLEVFLNDELTDTAAVASQGQILAGGKFPQTRPYTLHARGGEGLATLPGEPGSVSFVGDAQGFNDNEDTQGATFQTEPFTEDKLFVGLPKITLSASVTNPNVHLIATLFAVGEEGKRRRLTQCALNPILRDAPNTISPVVPSQVYALQPNCFAMAYKVLPGESLRLRVTTSDPDKIPMHSEDPRITVAFGGTEGTQITLPEVVGGALYADRIDLGEFGDAGAGA